MTAKCRSQIESGKDERESDTERRRVVFPFYFSKPNFKTKYLKNRLSKLRIVSTFKLFTSRSLKTDPILIGFNEFFLYSQFCITCTSCSVYFVLPFLYTLYFMFCVFLYFIFCVLVLSRVSVLCHSPSVNLLLHILCTLNSLFCVLCTPSVDFILSVLCTLYTFFRCSLYFSFCVVCTSSSVRFMYNVLCVVCTSYYIQFIHRSLYNLYTMLYFLLYSVLCVLRTTVQDAAGALVHGRQAGVHRVRACT